MQGEFLRFILQLAPEGTALPGESWFSFCVLLSFASLMRISKTFACESAYFSVRVIGNLPALDRKNATFCVGFEEIFSFSLLSMNLFLN